MTGAVMKRNNHMDWFPRYDFLLVKKCSGEGLSGRIKISQTGIFFVSNKNKFPVRRNKNIPDRVCLEEFHQSKKIISPIKILKFLKTVPSLSHSKHYSSIIKAGTWLQNWRGNKAKGH